MSGKGRRISRRLFLRNGSLAMGGVAAGSSLLGTMGCRCGAGEETTDQGSQAGGSVPNQWRDYEVRYNLRENLHLADIDHHGEFIDYGTAARYKYTLGNWRSGWGSDVEEQGTTFTWVASSPGRGYFNLEEAGPFQVVFRARRGDADRFSLYINDQAISRVDLSESWGEHRIAVDARTRNGQEIGHAGENSFKLTFRGSSERAFALDYMRIIPGEADPVTGEGFVTPVADALTQTFAVGEEDRPVLALRSPSRVSFYLDVPREAQLGFGLALMEGSAAAARVRVTDAQSGESERLHRTDLARGGEEPGWQDQMVDLGAFGGKVVRLDLEVEADGRQVEVAWSTPSILTRRAAAQAGATEPIRNVVVLLIDTLRADALTTYARTRIQSPQMDRFAREATVFERCQAPANWTKPSCASVLTGLHPPTHRALSESAAMSSSIQMVSEMFQGAGFQTSAFIANGYMASEFGFNQGWHLYRNYIREQRPTEAEHVFSDALTFIEEHRTQRTFTYIQTIDPHVPYDPPDEDLRLYDPHPYNGPVRPRSTGNLLEDFKRERVSLSGRDRAHLRALYDGEVTYHDRHFGRFLDRLRELGLDENTMIVVTSDHGEEFFEHDSVGHGHSLHQELLHVPLVVRAPGYANPGQRLPQVCNLVDIVPTVLDAARVDIPDDVEGRSLVQELRGGPPPAINASFSSQWDTGNDRELGWAVRVGDWKLRMRGPAISYLYDLSRDPQEANDVDAQHPLALRAGRIALGQFLGAPSKKYWASSVVQASGQAAGHQAEEATMTPELCQQLQALGYIDACD